MIEAVIPFRKRSIGSMEVRRILPYAKRRSVGPFVFVDDFGPIEIVSDRSMDVLPHPHIGLATVTYLFKGKLTHRDSIGSVQKITPGAVNYMNSGSGIVHSERVSGSDNGPGTQLAGLQTWVALPVKEEDSEPSFSHHGSDELPLIDVDGVAVKLILGEMFGSRSPVKTLGSPFYAECRANKGSVFELSAEIEERAIYGVQGAFSIDGRKMAPGELVVLKPGVRAVIGLTADSVFMIFGGPALERQRFMYWNFVSSSRDRIEAAKDAWKNGDFADIPDETGRIPLP